MAELIRAGEPFRFCTRLHLTELTGLKASTVGELLALLKAVPGSSIYHHTHRFLQQHQYLSPEPPNDFAYWITTAVREKELGERLASIDTVQFKSIDALREEIITTIARYLRESPSVGVKPVNENERFFFMKSISFICETDYAAYDLKEFAEILRKITIESIYYHIFEARLRLEKETNDFSLWIEKALGNKKIADNISRLDPYSYTLEELREKVASIIERYI
ncbi:MAG: DUF5752 family protein [Candidatus Omnitrophica bacterium]|nr:DUF5752 family protein [Candidatus Omnitrophota bacterium]